MVDEREGAGDEGPEFDNYVYCLALRENINFDFRAKFQPIIAHLPEFREQVGKKVSITKLDGLQYRCHWTIPDLHVGIATMYHPAYFMKPGKSALMQFAEVNYRKLPDLLQQVKDQED